MRSFLALGAILMSLAVVSEASADVRLVSLTSSVRGGGSVTLVARDVTSSRCSIRVHFGRRPPLAGISSRRPLYGVLRWTWTMPAHAARGRWTLDVSCGVESLHTSFLVK